MTSSASAVAAAASSAATSALIASVTQSDLASSLYSSFASAAPSATSVAISSSLDLSTSASAAAPSASATSAAVSYAGSCTTAPSTFAGTVKGMDSVCTTRYCKPEHVNTMSWSGLSGQVTREEIETAISVLNSTDPVLVNGDGNVLSDGTLGQAAYGAGLLFEVTGDVRALDIAVRLADNILWLQQEELSDSGELMWTGSREPVWPTYNLFPDNTTVLQYAGSEQGDVAAHMVQPAIYILKNKCLWDMVPETYDGAPSPFDTTTTYYDRALAYISAADLTVDYFLQYFFNDDDLLIQPDTPLWDLVGDTGNDPGSPMPWNRRFLTLHVFHKLAIAHRHSEALNASRADVLDHYIQVNVQDFFKYLTDSTSAGGDAAYVWQYVSDSQTNTEEVEGVHGYFDIWGVFGAWQRFPTLVTDARMTILGNTMQEVTNLRNGTFSGLVNGQSSSKAPSVSSLWGRWTVYSLWVDAWWSTVASANVAHGWGAGVTGSVPLLWTKQARYLDSADFWSGLYNTDDDDVSFSAGDEGGASLSAVAAAEVATTGDAVIAASYAASSSAAASSAGGGGADLVSSVLSEVSAQVSTVLYGTTQSVVTSYATVAVAAPSASAAVKVKGVASSAAAGKAAASATATATATGSAAAEAASKSASRSKSRSRSRATSRKASHAAKGHSSGYVSSRKSSKAAAVASSRASAASASAAGTASSGAGAGMDSRAAGWGVAAVALVVGVGAVLV